LDTARVVEQESAVQGASAHLMVIAHTPTA